MNDQALLIISIMTEKWFIKHPIYFLLDWSLLEIVMLFLPTKIVMLSSFF